jgi:hypothetical protein
MSDFKYKLVEGELVELTPEEIAQCEAEAADANQERQMQQLKAREIDAHVANTDVKTLIAEVLKRQAGIVT